MTNKTIYALDFDGVICDSAIETSLTGWKVAQRYWSDMQTATINDALIDAFRQVRPYLETGYEAILIMRLLHQSIEVEDLCLHYEQHMATLIAQEKLDTSTLKQDFGTMRDQWIAHNEAEWLDKNPLFTGIASKLHTLPMTQWYIITTKQERFVQRILAGAEIEFAAERIYGMDRQMSKQQVLGQLLTQHQTEQLVFIEDRLPTLQGIINNPALKSIKLQLVDWGYNTSQDRQAIVNTDIELITLDDFLI